MGAPRAGGVIASMGSGRGGRNQASEVVCDFVAMDPASMGSGRGGPESATTIAIEPTDGAFASMGSGRGGRNQIRV